jgi:peptide/nickel transport system substrate-binding protein
MFELEHQADSARLLLAQHGIDEDSRLTGLVLGTKPATADLAAALQHAWSEFGLDVAIDVAPSALDAERVAKSQVPLFRKSWLADYADAENFLSLFDSQRWAPKGPNYTHFSDSDVDMWLSQAAQMNEGEERQALLRKIEQLAMSQMPLIPLWHDEVLHLVSSDWTGWQISATNRLDLRKVRLSGQAPSVN